ncbi:F-box/FBD/LRR-repeat protein At3g52680 [Linum perenne]
MNDTISPVTDRTMKKKEASTIADGDSRNDDDDRISSLPDEILLEILVRLRSPSPKYVAKYASLSKRWKHLWLSYPVIEFDRNDYEYRSPSRSTMDSFIAAVGRKLSSSGLNYIRSVRIVSLDYEFTESILDLIQNKEPEEIHLHSRGSVIPTPLLNSSRLTTLKLVGCELSEQDQYMKMINVTLIHLSHVRIDNRVLSSMIAAAPLLEKLILECTGSSNSVEVCCNHANLKHLQISDYRNGSIQIVLGALQSLESLSLRLLSCNKLEMICSSLLPSLKSLEIYRCYKVTDHAVNELISKSPSLLSLRLVSRIRVNEMKIESPTLEKLELEWYGRDPQKKVMLYIDAPRLVNVHFTGDINCLNAIRLQAAEMSSCTFELSLKKCYPAANQFSMELKKLLRKVTLQFKFVELRVRYFEKGCIGWDQVKKDSPTPVIELVEAVPYNHLERLDQTFLYNMLWSCHTKYFSFRCDDYSKRLPSLKLINKVFMERTSPKCKKTACKCWRHLLKDVKIVDTRNREEEELMNISDDVLLALQSEKQVLFRLTWK